MVYNAAVQFVIHRHIKEEVPQATKQPLPVNGMMTVSF